MTIEEKAKAYDEAIEKVKPLYGRAKKDDSPIWATYEYLFPQLAESDGERVRKSLIKFLTDIKEISESGRPTWAVRKEDAEMCKSFLDYLEKQKEQESIKMEGTTICGQDYKCKKDYKAGNCWYIKDAIYHCGRDGYLTDQNSVSWSCTPEWFKEYIQSNTEWAEEEKTRFVSGQFLQCKLSFGGFKEGEHYWLEYIGDDMYVGRSDNILNQKFHITPRQLFTLFSQRLDEVQGPPEEEEKQVSLNYEPPFDENPSDKEIIEALIKHLKEQDGFLTAINCVSTKAILTWLEKQKEQKPEHFELKAGKWYICHRAFCARADHLTVKEGERFQCEKDGIVKGFVIKEPEKYFKECSAPEPMEKEQKPIVTHGETYHVDTLGTQQVIAGKMPQKSTEWSEEDERKRNGLIKGLQNRMGFASPNVPFTREEYIAWLESLPERFNLQPKQEWSEEDEIRMESCIMYLANARDGIEFSQHIGDNAKESSKKEIQKDIDWLKYLPLSLKRENERNWRFSIPDYINPSALNLKNEWSEDDDEAYKFVTALINSLVWRKDWVISKDKCLKMLEALRLQPHMVSIKNATKFGNLEYERGVKDGIQSEKSRQQEQSVAERFARIVRGNLIGIDKEVQQKFEQLYFEVTGNKMYGGYND